MHTDPYVTVQCELIGTQNDLTLRMPVHERPPFVYYLALLQEGTYNQVYTIRTATGPIQDVVFRLAKVSTVPETERYNEHQRELRTGVHLAERGICPKIFMNLAASMVVTGQREQYTTFGTAIERYDCSLADVQLCPRLMRQVFVEGNGESLLVDLYARAGATTRCIDTKPANVVVRLPDASRGISLALIDVDPVFCGDAVASPVRSSIMLALGSFLHGEGAFAPLSESALAVATMSILVHVTKAALDYILYGRGFGFPYIEITKSLLNNWLTVTRILDNDRISMQHRRMSVNGSVFQMLQSYWNDENRPKLSHPEQLYKFLLEMIGIRESRILNTCTIQKKPELYERIIVLTLGYKREQYYEKMKEVKMSESIEAWEAIVRNERLIPSPTARVCGSTSCTFHARSTVSGFGWTLYTTRVKKGNRSKRNKRSKRSKRSKLSKRSKRSKLSKRE